MEHKNITRNLEQAARNLVADMKTWPDPDSITTSLVQDIAFTLDQIDKLRELKGRQTKSLRRTECYVDTELMLMEARTPRYSPERFPERDKLQKRLFDIEAERRKHCVSYHDRLQALQKQLLSLMQKFGHVNVRNRKSGLEDVLKNGNSRQKPTTRRNHTQTNQQ